VVGNWDGQGGDGIGAVDNTNPNAGLVWYLRNSPSAGNPDYASFSYGSTAWIPVAGNWDGIPGDGIGVVNPNGPNGQLQWFLKNTIGAGNPDVPVFSYGGTNNTVPVVGDWDRNGTDTVGIAYRSPTELVWYLRNLNSADDGNNDVPGFTYGPASWIPIVGDWNGA
jgi:hypothetical protein